MSSNHLIPHIPWITQSLAAILGLVIGSFLNVVIHRLPKGLASFFYSSRSRCPHCDSLIAWYDNIPIFSFLLLHGRCRWCHENISRRYPLIELIMSCLAVLCLMRNGVNLGFLSDLIFSSLLLTAAAIDMEYLEIPDILTISGIFAGFLLAVFVPSPGLSASFIGASLGFFLPLILISLYEMLRGKIVMGGGDIKLFGMIGAFMGYQPLPTVVFFAALSGIFFSTVSLLHKETRKIPFVPFLLGSSVLVHFYPQSIIG